MSSHAREAAGAALIACVLIAGIEVVFVPIDAVTLPVWPIVWLDGLHAVFAALVGAWLWRRREHAHAVAANAAFLAVLLPFFPIIWIGESTAARLYLGREPMVPFQFLMLGISLLSPVSLWLAGGLLGLVAINAAALWLYLHHNYPLPGAVAEPWLTLIFGGIAAVFVLARLYRRAMLQRLDRASAETASLIRVSRLFLSVRDRANTPLQTIEFAIALLERRLPDEQHTIEAMRRALLRLRELSELVASEEANSTHVAAAKNSKG
jgi:hypothetical protein